MKNRIWANLRVSSLPPLTHLTSRRAGRLRRKLGYLAVCILPLAGCMKEGAFSAAETSVAAAEAEHTQSDEPTSVAVEPSGDSDVQESVAEVDQQSISNAPAKKVSTEIEVPASLKPSPATAEIIKLANAGVEESVMLSFVTNSLTTFNLRSEEIIYLKDIGIPSAVVTAMIQRDHLLQGAPSNLATTSSELEPSVPAPSPPVYTTEPDIPAPASDLAPLPDYASDNYSIPAEPEPSAADYSDYYDALAPYGTWVDVEGVGRCWQPTAVVVDHGWRPYFNCGRWVYSDCGWYWMSDYSWGWAPFHYGRWFQNGRLGWCWSPGRVWGPSWVCWRQSGDYCGWAPLPPGARFVAGVGMTFHGRPVRHDFSFGLGLDHFRFIHASRFMDRDLARNVLPRDHSARIYSHSIASTGIVDHNHRVSNLGIPREHVASAIHANILPVTLHNVTPSDGVGIRERFERNGRTLAVYRPDMGARIPTRPSATIRAQSSANTGLPSPSSPNHVNLTRIQPNRPQSASTTRPASTTPLPGRTETPVRAGQPLIVRGPDHPRETSISSSPNFTPQNPRHAVPLNSLVVVGQNRDSRVATAQPDHRPSWNSHNRTSPSHNRDFRGSSSQQMAREDQSDIRQPQTPSQPNWWAQPQQPRTSDHQQFRHNRDSSVQRSGNWNAEIDSPRHNPTPARVPEWSRSAPIQSYQPRPAPVETRPARTAPVESHQSRPVPMESHQSRPMSVESHQSHAAPAVSHSSPPAPASAPASSSSSSSSSRDSSSHSSGRGR